MDILHGKRGILLCLVACLAIVAACGGPEARKQKFFEKGKALYEKGDYVRAGLEFKNAIQVDPKFAEGYYMLGMTELRKKDIKKAIIISHT